MKLPTKRNRWYFFRELFSYMIPLILIIGTVDVFYHFMRCPLHPEWSAPCSINWIFAGIYGILLILAITLAIISTNKLRKIKKQIENEFLQSTSNNENIGKKSEETKKINTNKSKKIIVKSDKKTTKENPINKQIKK